MDFHLDFHSDFHVAWLHDMYLVHYQCLLCFSAKMSWKNGAVLCKRNNLNVTVNTNRKQTQDSMTRHEDIMNRKHKPKKQMKNGLV